VHSLDLLTNHFDEGLPHSFEKTTLLVI